MNKIGNYKIIVESQLIIIYVSGNIDVDDLIHLQRTLFADSLYISSFDVLVDLRDCISTPSQYDITSYIQFIKDNITYYQKRKGAYLTCKPNQVVTITLFSLMLNELPLETKIFSSITSIVHWLYYKHLDVQFIEYALLQLETQPNNVLKK